MVISLKLSIDLEKEREKPPVFALFAQRQLNNIKDNEEKSVSLSMSSGVLCKYTFYIAVSKKSHVKINKNDENEDDEFDEYYMFGEDEEEYYECSEEDMRDTERDFDEKLRRDKGMFEMMMKEEKTKKEERKKKEEEKKK